MRAYNFGGSGSSPMKRVQLFLGGGQRPFKIWKDKNVQNLVRFRTAFQFDSEYL